VKTNADNVQESDCVPQLLQDTIWITVDLRNAQMNVHHAIIQDSVQDVFLSITWETAPVVLATLTVMLVIRTDVPLLNQDTMSEFAL
jgi:hypothetical protein